MKKILACEVSFWGEFEASGLNVLCKLIVVAAAGKNGLEASIVRSYEYLYMFQKTVFYSQPTK